VCSTYITFLRVLVWMQNTLQATILLGQLGQVNVECFFYSHDVEVTAFCDWRLHDAALAEIPFGDIVNVASTLPAFQRLCTARMPVL